MATSASSSSAAKIADARVELALVDVDAENDLEAGGLQRGRDRVGVVHRIGEHADLFIGRVADDERHALFRGGWQGKEQGGQNEGKQRGQEGSERDAVPHGDLSGFLRGCGGVPNGAGGPAFTRQAWRLCG
jgi:hypothetical protein